MPEALSSMYAPMASMRPRLFTAENMSFPAASNVMPSASMRPRLFTAENGLPVKDSQAHPDALQ